MLSMIASLFAFHWYFLSSFFEREETAVQVAQLSYSLLFSGFVSNSGTCLPGLNGYNISPVNMLSSLVTMNLAKELSHR